MATPQLSPGVLVREVDLTVGRAENVLDNIGAIAGPFEIGPVDDVIEISTEEQLVNTFGSPIGTDAQYQYWMTASSFLSYGGVLKVVRTAGDNLNNANAGVGIASTTTLKIYNYDDYLNNHQSDATFTYSAKNPGTWGNGLQVCQIDDAADQVIGVATGNLFLAGARVGFGVTANIDGAIIPGIGTTGGFTGYLKGIITGVSTATGTGNTMSTIDVKITSRVSEIAGVTSYYPIEYAEGNSITAFSKTSACQFINNSGIKTGHTANPVINSAKDWYDEQTLGIQNATVYWKTLAPKPISSNFVTERSGKNDGMHIVLVDDEGRLTGIKGNIIEKHLNLSKAKDAVSAVNPPQKSYYKDYLATYSDNLYAGKNPSEGADSYFGTAPLATGFSTAFTPVTTGDGLWGLDAQGVTYSALGNVSYKLLYGQDYGSIPSGEVKGGMKATLADLMTSYRLFSNKDETQVDYLIMGPGCDTESDSQAKANQLLSIAGDRKDCMATISPHRANVVNITNTETQTENVLNFFSPLQSSSYGVFDSGYKYMFDRFNNEFRYIPCNGDVAGLMCRTNLTSYPWFSPAGQQRGVINNAVKLAYNPSKTQRDRLYPQRINSFITTPGIGTLLFGDKTALGYASAFDRINVRRLFLTIEQALEKAAQAQLFELNDELTRANFRNIVEPYLRDVQAKRGLYGFLVICDTTNNTPDVIDNNEFRADIFLKPAKSINYVTLTFVATRTGISFEEVAGRV
jgi:hypothetical protein